MLTTLERNPLRTSLSMTSGHESVAVVADDGPDRPFAYAFATWDPGRDDDLPEDLGYYDPDQQVWVATPGVITAGVPTKTRTGGSGCGDCVTDDACF